MRGRRYGPGMANWLISIGAIGAAFAALCCFTPAITVVLGIAGLLAWRDPVDLVALPILAVCALMIYGGIAMRRRAAAPE